MTSATGVADEDETRGPIEGVKKIEEAVRLHGETPLSRVAERPRCGRSTRALLLLALCALGACAGRFDIPPSIIDRVESGEIIPDRIVFACSGMVGDRFDPWYERLRDELAADGVLVIPLYFLSEPLGVIFDYGRWQPAAALARAVEALANVPGLDARFSAMGFSQGAEVILAAAATFRGARFDHVVFHRSSESIFTHDTARLLADGRIGRILATHSPIDGHTLLGPLGVGTTGQPGRPDRVANRRQFYPHLASFPTGTWLEMQRFLTGPAFRERRPVPPEVRRALAAELRRLAN